MIETDIDIHSYICKEHIAFLDGVTREEALKTLVDLLQPELEVVEPFYEEVIQRESIVSTGIGMGVALPHARTHRLEDFVTVIGISREKGIKWDAIDGVDVRLVFLVGGPEEAPKEYLTLLSQLTSLLKDEKFRSDLLKAKNVQSVVNIFHSC